MKTNHTTGEWTQGTNTNSEEWMKIFCNNKVVAVINTINKKGQRQQGDFEEENANTKLIAASPQLMQMVYDLKNCIKRLTEDGISQEDRDKEAQWIGEAHELLYKINNDYYNNANTLKL